MIRRRRRFKQVLSFKDRLAAWAQTIRTQADQLEPGFEREALLKRARQADTAAHLDDWANSTGLQAPR
jgi:hypothetical protein